PAAVQPYRPPASLEPEIVQGAGDVQPGRQRLHRPAPPPRIAPPCPQVPDTQLGLDDLQPAPGGLERDERPFTLSVVQPGRAGTPDDVGDKPFPPAQEAAPVPLIRVLDSPALV